jgi:replication fork protection complex subunit TIMELESS/Tof1/Swi1
VDIINVFYNMVNGPEALDRELPFFGDWKEFVRQLFKKLVKRVQERPELVVEMLFSKIPSTTFYLENGHDRQVVKNEPRPPVELEVKPVIATSDRISVVTEALISDTQFDIITWVKSELERAILEREAWEGLEAARVAGTISSEDTTQNEPAGGSQEKDQTNNGTEKPLPRVIGSPSLPFIIEILLTTCSCSPQRQRH